MLTAGSFHYGLLDIYCPHCQ